MSGPAQDDSGFTTAKDTPLLLDPSQLLVNDPAGTSFLGLGDATGGTVSQDENGNIVFTPNANYTGTASFEYYALDDLGEFSIATVTLSVTAANAAPVATNDSGFSTTEDTPVIISASTLLQNDTDGDGDALTLAGVSDAVGGTVAINAQGNVVFTPNANYNGAASFSYTVSDGNGGNSTATVSLTVTPVNDAPVANANTFSATEDTAITLTPAQLLGNDSDVEGNALTLSGVSNAVNGTVSINGAGNVVFTPAANFFGAASFQYSISDGQGGFSTATVTLNVAAVNDKPIVVNDSFSGSEDTALVLTSAQLLANDSDIEGSALTVLAVSSAVNGTVSKDGAGNITFIPAANYSGPASFQYVARDAQGAINTGTVSLSIAPVNDIPTATDDSGFYTVVDNGYPTGIFQIDTAALLANDTDLEGNAISVASVTSGTGGTVQLAGGIVYFQPDSGFVGEATFTYTVTDGMTGQPHDNVGTVTITVLPDGIMLNTIGQQAASGLGDTSDLVAADFNGDGVADIVTREGVIFGEDGELTTSLDGGSVGTATAAEFLALAGGTIGGQHVADLNGDGAADILRVEYNGNYDAVVRIYNGGSGADATADTELDLPFEGPGWHTVASGDFNGDGYLDLVIADGVDRSNDFYTPVGEHPAIGLWLGSATGFDAAPDAIGATGLDNQTSNHTYFEVVGMLDFNGDGYDDIVTQAWNFGEPQPGITRVTFGNAAGTFATDFTSGAGGMILENAPVLPGENATLQVGDVNGDGIDDMVVGGMVLFGNSSYGAGDSLDVATELNGRNGILLSAMTLPLLVADLNNDGIDDVVGGSTSYSTGYSVGILWGGEDGYSSATEFTSGTGDVIALTGVGIGTGLAAADLDGDGLIDLAIGMADGTIQVVNGTELSVYAAEGAGNDILIGTPDGDVLIGRGGNDSLLGQNGNDTLYGGSGIDFVDGGDGADTLYGGSGNDNVYGGTGNDTLYGGAGDDRLMGGTGADTMDGGDGSDIYDVDNIGDVVSDSGTTGVDSVGVTFSASLASFSGIENILLNGSTNIDATGNAGANLLGGNGGNNLLTGAGGDDILFGGAGSDTYMVGRGDGIDSVYQASFGAQPGIPGSPPTPTDFATTTDTLRFGSGVAFDQLWFSHVGNDLRIDVIGETASSVLLKDWYTDASRRVDVIETVDGGHALTSDNVEALVAAMASYTAPTAGEFTLNSQLANDLQPVFATTWA